MENILIRQETAADQPAVHALIEKAFALAEHSDGQEHELVKRLRLSSAFIPELSIIAESPEGIIGHILFTSVSIDGKPALALAPLAVHPRKQRQGVGAKLICAGHSIAKELDYEYCVVLGHAAYYPRFGYVPAKTYGIRAPFEVPEENFMACRLSGNKTEFSGVVAYAPEFFETQK